MYEKSEECCPKCGLVNEKKKRELKIVKGIAVKDTTTLEDLLNRKEQRKQQGMNKTLDELWEFKNLKGYKDFWVKHVFESRVLKAAEKEKHIVATWGNIAHDDQVTLLSMIITDKYGIKPASLSESDLKAAVHVAWNTFYSLKKLEMKKSYKKSY